jgi:hypothetical protein
MPDKEKAKINEMLADGRLNAKNALFSDPEMDYLNFLLNNSTFDNSWSIRNNYQHGIPNYDSPNHYEFDNHIALLVLLNHVVKINDELNLKKVRDGRDGVYCDIANE